ncbi:response regulator [Aeromonas veronii]|uniref:response regulator n=1 Tax=Aeromonas veronii TaxID=654 RepID=UPI0038F1D62F
MKKVLIVDDHPTIRMAVSMILSSASHSICGEANNGVDALRKYKELKPDVVVLDIGIPQMDGFEVIKRIKNDNVKTKIIILSAMDTQHIMIRCFQAGADGFVSKLDELTFITEAIAICCKGKPYFPRNVIVNGTYSKNINDPMIMKSLSDREMSVFLQLKRGLSNKDIANNMLLSEKTISTYKKRIMQKLNVTNFVELIEFTTLNEG